MNYNISSRIRTIISNLVLMLCLYSFSRALFYFLNLNTFKSAQWGDVALTFLVGLRFDLSAITILSAPYIILSLIPFQLYYHRRYQDFLKFVFFLCNIPIFIFHLADIELYKFFGSRMTNSVVTLAMEANVKHHLGLFVIQYWHIVLAAAICVYALFKLIRSAQPNYRQSHWSVYAVFSFLVLLFGLIAARGGLQKKVIQPASAFLHFKEDLAILSLNSSFTILKSKASDQLPSLTYYPSFEEAVQKIEKPVMTPVGKKGQNVVILILESLATEFWGVANGGEGYTPFLDSLATKGLFYRNHFANAKRSIEGVPAIIFGFPSLMDVPLPQSKYQFNTWYGLGRQMNSYGYHTSFFHSAEKGTMYIDTAAALAEIANFYPKEAYPYADRDSDGNWGIFDEPYLQYMVKKLSTLPTPFVTSVFTVSSHHPYTIPPELQGKLKKGPTPIYEAISYTDYAVQEFFKSASKEPWYKDTLFIITADHTQMVRSLNYDTALGRFMVPLLIYHPSIELKANTNKVVHQADIIPTILDFLEVEQPKLNLFGRSVWQEDEGRAFFYSNGTYYLVKNGIALEYNSSAGSFVFYEFEDPNELKVLRDLSEDKKQQIKEELLVFLQYYNNGLNENRLYDW